MLRYDEGEQLDRWLGFIKNRDPLADAFTYIRAKALSESYKNNEATVRQAANGFRSIGATCWPRTSSGTETKVWASPRR